VYAPNHVIHASRGRRLVTAYRCAACGNKTRFDVVEAKRVRSFLHFTLGGEVTIDEEEVLERTVEKVVCRWCGSTEAIEAIETGAASEG
jgi:DNA-directed RNA polymerase subunit RPC12/RpoP